MHECRIRLWADEYGLELDLVSMMCDFSHSKALRAYEQISHNKSAENKNKITTAKKYFKRNKTGMMSLIILIELVCDI